VPHVLRHAFLQVAGRRPPRCGTGSREEIRPTRRIVPGRGVCWQFRSASVDCRRSRPSL